VNWSYGSHTWTFVGGSGDLFAEINNYREGRGLPRLRWHDGMSLVADTHVKDMQAQNYVGLVSPQGIDMFERMVSSNPRIDFDQAYAFVAYTQDENKVFRQLMDVPDSRLVLEDPSITHIGLGDANTGFNFVTYWAIIFARNARP
jgi:uncharacterized protein YkwD